MLQEEANREIKDKIMMNGQKVFSAKGFKKTGIREIVELTNISIGTFYNYFDSKEALFLSIYLKENKNALADIQNKLIKMAEQDKDPVKIIKLLVYTFFDNAKNNSILREFFNREQFDKIMKKLTPEANKEYLDHILGPLIPYIDKWKKEGKIIDIRPRLLIGIFDSLAYVYSHKEHLGEELFPELLDYLIEAVVEKLRPKD